MIHKDDRTRLDKNIFVITGNIYTETIEKIERTTQEILDHIYSEEELKYLKNGILKLENAKPKASKEKRLKVLKMIEDKIKAP